MYRTFENYIQKHKNFADGMPKKEGELRLTAKEKRALKIASEEMTEAEYDDMEKHCPEKVRQTKRKPVMALEYQKRIRELKGTENDSDRIHHRAVDRK